MEYSRKVVLQCPSWIKTGIQVGLASLLLAFFAQIKIPLFFTPVPISLQTLATMLIGCILGSKKGSAAAFLYLLQGALGAPFFAGGSWGVSVLLGPTGGYLLAYPLQTFLVGKSMEREHVRPFFMALSLIAVVVLQLGIGTLWLACFVGIKNCMECGFYPFLLGDVAKALFATYLWKIKNMRGVLC